MGTSIFNIGVGALNAAQAGLLTTGHNISNAATPGFNRQQTVQTTNTPQFTGAGFLGQGTNVVTVKRIYSQFLANQVMSAQTQQSELSTYSNEIKQIDNLLADQSAGVSPALQEFFNGVQEVSASPASIPARQAMLSGAQALVARFQALDQRLGEMRDGVNTQITSTVTEINSYAQQIASLNQRIVLAQAAGPTQPANDLLDQRDQLIDELNQRIRVTTTTEADGSYSVFIGSGQPLVVGQQSFGLTATPAADDPERMEVGLAKPGGGTIALQESLLSGGTLGGLLAYRSQTLDPAQNGLGRIAIGLAQTFNDQHRLGQDLLGNLGGNFFAAPPAPRVYAASTNSGGANVTASISNAANLSDSDYRITYAAGNYTLIRLSDNTTTNLGAFVAPVTVDGVTFSNTGTAAANGDTFLIQPTRTGARDIAVAITDARNIAAAAPVRTSATLANTGTATISVGSVDAPPPTNANLQQPVTITFTSPTTFNVTGTGTGNPVGLTYTAGANISYNGWTLQISGTPAAGDSFSVGPNTQGVADNRNALALGQLQTQNTLLGGTASYQSAYSQIVSEVGNKAREVEVTLSTQDSLVSQAQSAQQSLSGVNLDEEAANLLRYQQAYQAAGKMIDIASKLFDELLAIGR